MCDGPCVEPALPEGVYVFLGKHRNADEAQREADEAAKPAKPSRRSRKLAEDRARRLAETTARRKDEDR